MLLATDLSTGLAGDCIYNTSLKTFCNRMPDVTEEPDLGFCRCKIDDDIQYFHMEIVSLWETLEITNEKMVTLVVGDTRFNIVCTPDNLRELASICRLFPGSWPCSFLSR
jgi:hypothetical protein